MSTFKQKKELKAQIKAAEAAGKSRQTIGRLQYKLNNLTADPKGNAVKTKSGVVKTSSGGTVRTKPSPNATISKRVISKGTASPTKTGGHPSAGRTVAPKKKSNTVTTTGLNGKSQTVAAGSGKVIDVKSGSTLKTKTGSARGGSRFGPNAAKNKRITELERLIKEDKNNKSKRTSAR
jgi:hypothetical protein